MAQLLYVTNILIEPGALRLLASECERLGIQHPLVVTDPGVKAAGLLDRTLTALGGALASRTAVFDQTSPNPHEAVVREAAALYRQHSCDGLIALGGGSAIDCAKGVEAQTRKLFRVCRQRAIPIFTFVNKLDRPGRDAFELIGEVECVLGIGVYPVTWPISKRRTAISRRSWSR